MAKHKDGHHRLNRYRVSQALSVRAAARELGVTHAGYLAWESGRNPPSPVWRAALERWSGGLVGATSWPLSPRERDESMRAERVERRPSTGPGAA